MEKENNKVDVNQFMGKGETEFQAEPTNEWEATRDKNNVQEPERQKVETSYNNVLRKIRTGEITQEEYDSKYKELESVDETVLFDAMANKNNIAKELVNKSRELRVESKKIFFDRKVKAVLGRLVHDEYCQDWDSEDIKKAKNSLSTEKLGRFAQMMMQK